MAIDAVYLSFANAALLHHELMQQWGETRYGVFDRTLIESALARPLQAAAYDGADVPKQAATLLYGLIKNHPWLGGNKRTAFALTQLFLQRNELKIIAGSDEVLKLVYAVDADEWRLPQIEGWLRRRVHKMSAPRSSNHASTTEVLLRDRRF